MLGKVPSKIKIYWLFIILPPFEIAYPSPVVTPLVGLAYKPGVPSDEFLDDEITEFNVNIGSQYGSALNGLNPSPGVNTNGTHIIFVAGDGSNGDEGITSPLTTLAGRGGDV